MAATTLATLLRRMYEASTCEIDNLISELRGLWDKPETDCDRLESDIAEHAKQSRDYLRQFEKATEGSVYQPIARTNLRCL